MIIRYPFYCIESHIGKENCDCDDPICKYFRVSFTHDPRLYYYGKESYAMSLVVARMFVIRWPHIKVRNIGRFLYSTIIDHTYNLMCKGIIIPKER